MTDQELIDLLLQKLPEDLSLDELAALKTRLAESPRLREVLFEQLQMEAYLAAALSRVEITPQQILARAQKPQPGGRTWWVAALVLLPIAALGSWAIWQRMNPPREAIALAPAQPEKADPPEMPPAETPAESATPDGAPPDSPPPPVTPPVENPPPVSPAPEVKGRPRGSKSEPAPTPQAVPPPWDEVLARVGEQPAFREVCFDPIDEKAAPRSETLAAWLEPVPGFIQRIKKGQSRFGRCEEFEGLVRLRCPWTADSAVKLSLENYNRLQWHFFHGDVGVTIAYYEDQNFRWAAFTTTRQKGSVRPDHWTLTSTDDDRCRRTEIRFGGPLELRYREGQVIVSRGDVPLVAAPLPGPPEDVYLDGHAMFYGLEFLRTKDNPPPIPDHAVTVWKTDKPAELDWQPRDAKLPPLERLAAGGVRLTADNAPTRSEWFVRLPAATAPREVIVELADVTFGSGIFWGRPNGDLIESVRLLRNSRDNKQTGLTIRGNDDEVNFDFPPPHEKPSALVSGRIWLKFRVGCGNLKWWQSADGVHWAQPEPPRDWYQPDVATFGLQCVANRPQASITLKSIQIRELPALAALASKELRDQAAALPVAAPVKSIQEWQPPMVAAQPAGVDASEWLRACALVYLGRGAQRPLAQELLELLLDDSHTRGLALDQQRGVLDDALALMFDMRNDQGMKSNVWQRFFNLAQEAFEKEGRRPVSFLRQSLALEPMWPYTAPDLPLLPLVKTQAVQLLEQGKFAEAQDFAKLLAFYHVNETVPLVGWIDSTARRGLPARAAGESVAKVRDGWRNPLVEELSKEAYNRSSELRGFLESESWNEAARMITTLTPDSAPGLAPAASDRSLLVSLPTAIRLTLQSHPQLAQTVAEQFQPLARLRLEQAIGAADAAAVELTAVQFPGSEASAEAHQWLGDRALASGWFERAIAEYRLALAEGASPSVRTAVQPRLRLAGAMLGRDLGSRPTVTVSFNDRKLAPDEFETLITELRGRGDKQSLNIRPITAGEPAGVVPASSAYEVGAKARLDGTIGDKPEIEGARHVNQLKIPWADRQLAAVVEGETLYVSNRFQVGAYNLANGQRLWQSPPPPTAKMQRAQDWALVPMRPLLSADRIFVRQLMQRTAPWLACLERASGKTLWTQPLREHEYLISDPVWLQGQLVALTLGADEQDGAVRWTVFDPESGTVQEQRDLIRVRASWALRHCCELAVLDDGLVVALGGVTLGCSAAGEVRWVRTHTMLPSEEDPTWIQQAFQRPLAWGDKVLVAQPGVTTIDCLQTATGRKTWSRLVPGLQGLVGISRGHVIACTETGLRAFAAVDGQPLWDRPLAAMHPAALCNDDGLVVVTHPKAEKSANQLARLQWIDPATGQVTAEQDVAGLESPDPRLGLLIPYQDKLWTFFGQGQLDANRDVVELKRK